MLYSLCYHIAFLLLLFWHSLSQINLRLCVIPHRVEDDSPVLASSVSSPFMSESAASRPFSAISNGSAWQLARSRPTNTAKAQRHALFEYMPLRPCAISDLCKIRFTSRGGYNGYLSLCGYSLCFRVGVIGGKVTIYLRNDKGNGKKFLREVGEYEMLNAQ